MLQKTRVGSLKQNHVMLKTEDQLQLINSQGRRDHRPLLARLDLKLRYSKNDFLRRTTWDHDILVRDMRLLPRVRSSFVLLPLLVQGAQGALAPSQQSRIRASVAFLLPRNCCSSSFLVNSACDEQFSVGEAKLLLVEGRVGVRRAGELERLGR